MSSIPSVIMEAQAAKEVYRNLLRVATQPNLELGQQFALLHRIFTECYIDICRVEKIPFNNLYSRMAFIEHRYRLPRWLSSRLHSFRIFSKKEQKEDQEKKEAYDLGMSALMQLVEFLSKQQPPASLVTLFPDDKTAIWYPNYKKEYRESIRITVLEIDDQQKLIVAKSEISPSETITVQYDIADYNDNFTEQIEQLPAFIGLPCIVQLLKVKTNKAGVLEPKMFIIEPDLLIDISAISESFQPFEVLPEFYMLKKYLPFSPGIPLLVGNIANAFLDELLLNDEAEFKDLVKNIFKLQPLSLVTLNDDEVRELVQKIKTHFLVLKEIVKNGLPRADIDPNQICLEPTFFSSDHGIQGRLDLFYPDPEKPAMIELKSGKVYKPNTYGLARNHYTQTLLYDLLIKFTSKQQLKPTNYILYSQMAEAPLRFAPPALNHQVQAMVVRNQIVFSEFKLSKLNLEDKFDETNWIYDLNPHNYPQLKGFHQRDLQRFSKILNEASPLEKKFFFNFTSFIAREQLIAKIGIHGSDRSQGQAALWLDTLETKQNRFDILEGLHLLKNDSSEEEPLLHFDRRSAHSLSNFRKGDIVIFYQTPEVDESPLHYQLFKGTILVLEAKTVVIRLRYKQFNSKVFETGTAWRAEHDIMDVSFTNLHKNLFRFLAAATKKKSLLLGLATPKPYHYANKIPKPDDLSDHQFNVLQKTLTSEDYFLLWGPPGTGKTSVLLRHLVKHILAEEKEDLMLLAYTNRAVDEMCEAIEQIGDHIRDLYLRIGSRYSTKENFVDQLLQIKLETIDNRKELHNLIGKKRIIVGTVASMLSKPELFKLKRFGTVIIDEASQILEPMLAGLLPKFKKFILIGDHQQLPAVVLQSPDDSKIDDPALHELGLFNMRHSLFERLYRRAREYNWHWAYDRLNEQGRLHKKLMHFSNQFFYEGCLDLIPNQIMGSDRQTAPLVFKALDQASEIGQQIQTHRALFIDTPPDLNSPSGKTNHFEAAKVADAVDHFLQLYKSSGKSLHDNSIGIITPYRAQIATIQAALIERKIPYDNISIDTVERYQGGARDIILLSLCTNSKRQLQQLISTSDDGIDRKLNVAITRSKEQLIIFGSEEILLENELYRNLIFWAGRKSE